MIITNNEQLLRIKCVDVLPDEIGPLREALELELANSARLGRPGIGLAAPQIGIAKKMAIIRVGSKELDIDLINCTLAHGYDEAIHREEGCLSFPGRVEDTMRYQEVHLVGNLIYPQAMILTGLMAVCAQHELDHLNGILLPDKALPKSTMKVGPNNLCPCGSKMKYKKCHGK